MTRVLLIRIAQADAHVALNHLLQSVHRTWTKKDYGMGTDIVYNESYSIDCGPSDFIKVILYNDSPLFRPGEPRRARWLVGDSTHARQTQDYSHPRVCPCAAADQALAEANVPVSELTSALNTMREVPLPLFLVSDWEAHSHGASVSTVRAAVHQRHLPCHRICDHEALPHACPRACRPPAPRPLA